MKSGILLISLALLIFVSSALADCPHCFQMVQVKVQLKDGSSRSGYYELHESRTPLFRDSNDVTEIKLPLDSAAAEGRFILFDSLYQFKNITCAVLDSDGDSLDWPVLEKIQILDTLPCRGAGQVNRYSKERIEKLAKPYLSLASAQTADLAMATYVNYNPEIPESTLQSLASFQHSGYYDLQYFILDFLSVTRRRAPEEDSAQMPSQLAHIAQELSRFSADADELSRNSALGHFYKRFDEPLSHLIDICRSAADFAANGNIEKFIAGLNAPFNWFVMQNYAGDSGPAVEVNKRNSVVEAVLEQYRKIYSQLPPLPSFQELETADILVCMNYYD